MFESFLTIQELFLLLLQTNLGVVENAVKILKEGGMLGGALLVLYGQHKFYRYMIDKLEEKHNAQVTYLEGQIEEMIRNERDRSRQDSIMIDRLTRNQNVGGK